MSDKYLEIANSALGKKIFNAVGLPDPVPLLREDATQPHKLSGQLLLGESLGAVFAKSIGAFVESAGIKRYSESLEGRGHLVFDASGIANAQQSTQLHSFFSQHLKSLAPSGLEEVSIGVWNSKNSSFDISLLINEITFDLRTIFLCI